MEKLFSKKPQNKPKNNNLGKRNPGAPQKGKGGNKGPKKARGKGRKGKGGRRLRPEEKLKSSQFRLLNEFLYTNDSKTSQEYFKKRQNDFEIVQKATQAKFKKFCCF